MTDATKAGDTPAMKALQDRLDALGIDPESTPDIPQGETPEDRAERLAQAHAHRRARWQARVPVMYQDADVAQIAPEQVRGGRFAWPDQSLNLVLAGPVGTGKTHAAYALGNALVARGVWVEAFTVMDLLDALRPDGDPQVAGWARRCEVLVLDDLGATKASEWAVEQMTGLLDARLREGRRTIVTTNAPWDALNATWGARFMDRLAFRLTTMVMLGASRRAAAW